MALVINDRVKESTATTGTGTVTLGGAIQGFETFLAGVGNSNTTYYCIVLNAEFEVGLGTLAGDSSTLARTTVISSSNSDNAVNFSSGTKFVFCCLPASKTTILDASNNLTLPGKLSMPDVTSGKILVADGTSYEEVAVSGDVTIASSGAITIANNAVETAMINADAVTGAKIADDAINSEHYTDGSIDTAHIADSQITNAKMADNAIDTAEIAASAVETAKINNGAVTTDKLGADAVDGTKIGDDQINSEHYVAGSIDTEHIADAQITTAKIVDANVTTAKITDANVTTAKIAADAITGAKIADDAINSEHYTNASIDTAHIADLQVTTAKIAADAITGAKIADDAINSEHYTNASIDTAHIANDQITNALMADDAIDSAQIADGSVDTAHIADLNVTTGKIAADAITGAKLADDAVNSEHYTDASIDTAHIADAQITTAKVADNAITTAKLADNLAPSRPNALPIIINGNMAIAQRAHGAVTGLGDGDEGYVSVDRIRHTIDGTTAGRFSSSQAQISDLPGFAESILIDCTTADTSIAAGEGFNLEYKFEGHDLHHLQTGHSTAKPFTIAFYAKADAAVVYSVEFKNTDHNRHCTRAFTTTTGWTRHVLAFPADTASQYTNDNQHSASLRFWLHAGSNFTSGTPANVFQGVTTANTVRDIGSIFANTSRFINITGIQMEVGSFTADTIPDFQYEGYGENLQRCKRYCQSTFNQHEDIGAASAVGIIITCATGTGTGRVATGHQFPVSFRVSPTIVVRNQTGGTTGSGRNGDTGGLVTMSAGNASTDSGHFENSENFGNDGAQLQFQFSATAEL